MSEENTVEENIEAPDPLSMSDDEFNEYLANGIPEEPVEDSNTEEVPEEEEESTEEEVEATSDESDTTEEESTESQSQETKDIFEGNDVGDSTEESNEETEDKQPETSIDYEAEYKRILSPFKANGKEIQVSSIDDAITLMQMGANYNKKMAGLKPNLKLIKMLENHNLLDENKLSYLIDLDKKDPNAISKLIKESGVDPLDIDTNEDSNYKPNTYTVDDKQVELDGILEEIRDTNSFNTTIDVISNKWDEASKRVLYDNPNIIKIINEHVNSGIYDQISSVVESEKMLGRLTGMSDIEAYKAVGDALNAQGKFNNPANQQQVSNKSTVTKKVDPKLKDRKKAASSTKGKPSSSKVNDNFNPLSMSDEEFEKMASNKFI